jgi:hypothetical protein
MSGRSQLPAAGPSSSASVMRLVIALAAATTSLWSAPAGAQKDVSDPSSAALYDPVCNSASDAEVVICGRRNADRYRLPPEYREQAEHYRDGRRVVLDGSLNCKNVGPQGCGLKPLPIVTIGSDGQVTIGDPDPDED